MKILVYLKLLFWLKSRTPNFIEDIEHQKEILPTNSQLTFQLFIMNYVH